MRIDPFYKFIVGMFALLMSILLLAGFFRWIEGAVNRSEHRRLVAQSDMLTMRGAADGSFIVVERKLSHPYEPIGFVFFVLNSSRSGDSELIISVDGQYSRDLHDELDKIVKVINRDDAEWGKYAERFIRERFWDNNQDR